MEIEEVQPPLPPLETTAAPSAALDDVLGDEADERAGDGRAEGGGEVVGGRLLTGRHRMRWLAPHERMAACGAFIHERECSSTGEYAVRTRCVSDDSMCWNKRRPHAR